ncbi:MAG: phosphatase PAP2 family protein [Bacteroidetes bacterium]|nr:phosphatase PAP2 family protein [Bacteroidota bacterium]
MLESIKNIDEKLFLILNGTHNAFFDAVMYWSSEKFFWIPFYALLLWLMYRKLKGKTFLLLFFIILLIAVTDQTSVRFFKNVFLRLRPCHEPHLEGLVRLVADSCGGMYGFISNHAANTFALAWFLSGALRKKMRFIAPALLLWASLVSYSRIYVGVHYPGDVLAGALWGVIVSIVILFFYRFIEKKI